MTHRDDVFTAFLQANGWGTAQRDAIKQDASKRRYLRLTRPSRTTCIAMDIPADATERPDDIVRITHHLRSIQLGAPEIYAVDADHGFLLVEDLGPLRYADEFKSSPQLQRPRYIAAIDALVHLQHNAPAANLPVAGPDVLAQMIDPLFEYYLQAPCDPDQKQSLTREFFKVLSENLTGPMVMSLRDCHAENLIWVGTKTGHARVGLIDYQDAFLTHPAYDIVSLVFDVRRDIPDDLRCDLIDHYIAQSGHDADHMKTAIALINVQRNMRILGVFARLAKQQKPNYLDWAPRTWAFIEQGLRDPCMAPIASEIRQIVTPPTPQHIQWLRSC